MGYLGAILTQVFARERCGRVTHRCRNRNSRWETGLESANDVTHRKRTVDLGNFEEGQLSWFLPRKKTVGFRLIAEARPVVLWRVPHVLGVGDGKVIIERLCISLSYVETFNSKVIKGFVPELRSRYVFFVFRDSYVLCIYVMNILCTFHVAISWLCNNST